ncbi:hypothetical protein Y032_0021g444 [Ancylostoma ceylanicum]|uniref:G-protein coupled receptors family 1 profile domain-containing protein n=1 Tax=Ancylostoma ceylanicum TaxID=53326 RepID=A0A016V1C3_9BILA|nr:hypothetical protein Y032_0021g444 [Ancylostoma ceylanicum]
MIFITENPTANCTLLKPDEWVPIGPQMTAMMKQLLSVNLILIICGLISALVNIPLLYVLFASQKLRGESKLLICLSCGDVCNCLGIALLGFYRYTLFMHCLSTRTIPCETSLSCAKKPFVWFRAVGNVFPPLVLVIMGFDRLFATTVPILYKKFFRDKGIYSCAFSIFCVIMFMIVAMGLSIRHDWDGVVKFDCGRKATFTIPFAKVIYVWEMTGYAISLLLNVAAYLRALTIITFPAIRDQMKRIRITLVLGVLSTVLVAIPNFKSLFYDQLRFAGMDEWVSQMVVWASIINSSINLVVYILLYREFREEFITILGLSKWLGHLVKSHNASAPTMLSTRRSAQHDSQK